MTETTPITHKATLTPAGTEVHVAGVTHYRDAVKAAEGRPAIFVLVPEPTNPYDANAIAVYTGGRQVGHVPAELTKVYGDLLRQFGAKGIQLQWGGEAGQWGEGQGVYARFDSPSAKQLQKIIDGGDESIEASHPVAAKVAQPRQRRRMGLATRIALIVVFAAAAVIWAILVIRWTGN